MAQLPGGRLIDARPQRLQNCQAFEQDAWSRAVAACAQRGLALCIADEYRQAYDGGVLAAPQAYAYTATVAGCVDPKFHVLLAAGRRFRERPDGCHSHAGCFADRYYRCCGSASDVRNGESGAVKVCKPEVTRSETVTTQLLLKVFNSVPKFHLAS